MPLQEVPARVDDSIPRRAPVGEGSLSACIPRPRKKVRQAEADSVLRTDLLSSQEREELDPDQPK